ncbi:MAG TPA: RNA-binding protein [Gammaproteobacteria bacterium]|nr:RNA-binding protein [Gammaproteobacteria bacterium]
MSSVRLDTWLWAARFFKSRARAKDAIAGGKVHLNGARSKPSKNLAIDDELVIRQGWDEKTVIVKGLSDKRSGAPIAQHLYEETPESLEKRELAGLQRKATGSLITQSRPNKRDRRLIHKFRERNLR